MIELSEVVKEFRRHWYGTGAPVRALNGVTLRVDRGTALGIIGLNGAGKSTLLRLLLGYIRPSSGRVSIDGRLPRTYVQKSGVAYVPERVTIPRQWSVRHALKSYAMLGEVGTEVWPERVELALEQMGLVPLADRKVGALSKGNLQRLGIAQAILGDRKVMVLDEPTDGLDPVWISRLRSILEEWRREDDTRILILASHNLPEVERLTDRVVLLHNGRIDYGFEYEPGALDLEAEFLRRLEQLEAARP